jgi:hypothetical protein
MSVSNTKKSKSTVIVDPKMPIKPEFEKELENGIITKIPKIKNKKQVYVNAKGQRVNENGELLTKRGQIDKRSLNKAVGEVSKRHWQEVAEKNKKNPNVKVVATVESDSDSEPEFEIETIQPPPPPPPPVEPPPQPTRTEMFIKEEQEKRKKFDEEIFKLKEENTKLKSGLVFNDHLNRISHMAKSVKLKF